MTSTESVRIVKGPGRYELAVSCTFNPPGNLHYQTPSVVFELEKGVSAHLNKIEVEITALEFFDKLFGRLYFRGFVVTQEDWKVEGAYCAHSRLGKMFLHAPKKGWYERLS